MTQSADESALISVRQLQTHFVKRGWFSERVLRRPAGAVRAVDGVDLDINRGEILGIVGESGSGKTTLAKTILRLTPATSGTIVFDDVDITRLRGSDLAPLRRHAQIVHQDPHASLSPRLRVSSLLTEPYRIHHTPGAERRPVAELLDMVGLSQDLARAYPHELSGGQARRVGIARALALKPSLVVADEPTAGLDVSAAANILNLLRDLVAQLGLTCLVITHDLGIVDYLADRIAVMYLGKIFEIGPTERILDNPAHPYTHALLSAVPEPDRRRSHPPDLLPGEIPSPKNPPRGCRFHPRCEFADELSRTVEPVLGEAETDHLVACHHWQRVRDELDKESR